MPDLNAHVLAREVSRRLFEQLDWLKITPGRILDAGCGAGLDAPTLQSRFPSATYTGIDIASEALRAGQKGGRQGVLGRLSAALGMPKGTRNQGANWVCADIGQLPFAASCFDLVWSNLAMHWVSDMEAALRGLRAVLQPEGLLLFSCYGPDTLKELRDAFAMADDHVHVNTFLDMHDVGDILVRSGYSNPVISMECITMTYREVRDVIMEIKRMGENALQIRGRAGLMGRGVWQRMTESYEGLRNEGRLPATYEVVYGHAWAAGSHLQDSSGLGWPIRWFQRGTLGV